jgi:dTDP-4-amino-4,6-dideoxygalactose transaminase
MYAHQEPAYSSRPLRFALPQSEEARRSCIVLPLFDQMTDDDQQEVAQNLQQVCC